MKKTKKKRKTNKNRKKRLIILSSTIIISILIIALLIVAGLLLKKEKPVTKPVPSPIIEKNLDEQQKKVVEISKNFHSYIVDSKKTTNDLATLTGIKAGNYISMVGSDTILGSNYPEEFKNELTKDLSEYEHIKTTAMKKIVKKIENNYKYELVDSPIYTEDKKQLMQQTKVTPYSFELMRRDQIVLTDKLLDLAKAPKMEEKAEPLLYYYKARIIALKIISNNLSEYNNKETFKANMIYNILEDGTIKCENCDTYINYCQGQYNANVKYAKGIDYYEKNSESRILKMIKQAKEDSIINSENPLKI